MVGQGQVTDQNCREVLKEHQNRCMKLMADVAEAHDEIDRMRGRFQFIASLEGGEDMTDYKFAQIVLGVAQSEISPERKAQDDGT